MLQSLCNQCELTVSLDSRTVRRQSNQRTTWTKRSLRRDLARAILNSGGRAGSASTLRFCHRKYRLVTSNTMIDHTIVSTRGYRPYRLRRDNRGLMFDHLQPFPKLNFCLFTKGNKASVSISREERALSTCISSSSSVYWNRTHWVILDSSCRGTLRAICIAVIAKVRLHAWN